MKPTHLFKISQDELAEFITECDFLSDRPIGQQFCAKYHLRDNQLWNKSKSADCLRIIFNRYVDVGRKH